MNDLPAQGKVKLRKPPPEHTPLDPNKHFKILVTHSGNLGAKLHATVCPHCHAVVVSYDEHIEWHDVNMSLDGDLG